MEISYLTGFEVKNSFWPGDDYLHQNEYEEPYNIGKWASLKSIHEDGFKIDGRACIYGTDDKDEKRNIRLNKDETNKMINLAISKIWIANQKYKLIPYFIYRSSNATIEEKSQLQKRIGNIYNIIYLDELYDEMKALSLEKKTFHTLNNLCIAEKGVGKGLYLNAALGFYPGKIWDIDTAKKVNQDAIPTKGICYGCTDDEALVVFQHLKDKKYIILDKKFPDENDQIIKIFITLEGYIQADKIRTGKNRETASGFLICRFIDEITGETGIQKTVYDPVSREVKCKIQTVTDIPHNDRIDDRIMREIQEASVIVVDLTDHNFNVAFEAGYALALGKPIIWTMYKNSAFNIYLYTDDTYDEVKKQIIEKEKAEIHWINNSLDNINDNDMQDAATIVVDTDIKSLNHILKICKALSLSKRIIWTMRKTDDKPNLPFDIQSHNILLYSLDNLDEFKKIFEARMLTALDTVFGAEKN